MRLNPGFVENWWKSVDGSLGFCYPMSFHEETLRPITVLDVK